ncbi:MAG: acyl-ACP--UDP-N-acetylglucosamine O-acyltransferase [Desulfurivibrionaceae bacterium]|nr:acyl-ACP--UDP-N-acetylglucosamine O-acyltransferase [Desulfobulbales bacterium]MDT8335390.1 acyl-ACP--UDP-N-acetylglucosamine O-acyltransferase [Desulfurivibrionaceae bacterium]
MNIHQTAVIDPGAELDSTVIVGPYAVVEKGVKIGADTEIGAHAVIQGITEIGVGNKIGPFAIVGGPPQDLSYKNEPTRVIIGNNNLIREYVSIHRGTVRGRGETVIGNENMLMGYSHVAHDCVLGNHIIIANGGTLGGHVVIEDMASLGGHVGVHQFSRIGTFSYVGGVSGVTKDVPPYMIVAGTRNQMRVSGINHIGLKRNGVSTDDIKKLRGAFKIIFLNQELLLKEALDRTLEAYPGCGLVVHLVEFIRASQRGIVRRVGEDE